MTEIEQKVYLEKPFQDKKVYYSGSIHGIVNHEPDFAWQLVQFMIQGGADVLSEHVAARTREEMDDIFIKKAGYNFKNIARPWFRIRQTDLMWVDQAGHMVAVVNGPSHGVGMEIERALHKPIIGLNRTPILALIHDQLLGKLSWMIRGIDNPDFYLRTYSNLDEVKLLIDHFLRDNPPLQKGH